LDLLLALLCMSCLSQSTWTELEYSTVWSRCLYHPRYCCRHLCLAVVVHVCLCLQRFLKYGTALAAKTESDFNSVERVVQYLTPETEAAEETAPEVADKLPKDWPASKLFWHTLRSSPLLNKCWLLVLVGVVKHVALKSTIQCKGLTVALRCVLCLQLAPLLSVTWSCATALACHWCCVASALMSLVVTRLAWWAAQAAARVPYCWPCSGAGPSDHCCCRLAAACACSSGCQEMCRRVGLVVCTALLAHLAACTPAR
jgi:hypothetical protein